MFAGAVKASGIGCGNQFRSLCLIPAILVFFPLSLRSLRTRFVKTPFFLISSWATIEHLRSFWRKTRHSASVLGQGPHHEMLLDKRWRDSCAQVLPGQTLAERIRKSFRPFKHTCIAYNKGTKPQHHSRPWFCTNRRPHPFLDPLLLLSPQPRINAKIQAVAQPLRRNLRRAACCASL